MEIKVPPRFLLFFFFFLLLSPAYTGSSKHSLSQSLMSAVCSPLWLVWYDSINVALVHLCFTAFPLLKIIIIIKRSIFMLPHLHMLIKEEQAFKGKLLPCLNFFPLTYLSLFLPFSPFHICIRWKKPLLYNTQQKFSRCFMRSTNKQLMCLASGSPWL